jgi:hypothetical protein
MAQYHCVLLRRSVPLLLVCVPFVATVKAVPVVWTGSSITFAKAGSADPTLATNQDRLTNSVWLTRGSSEGMFNIAPDHETGYTRYTSPADMKWATDVMSANIGKNITAALGRLGTGLRRPRLCATR